LQENPILIEGKEILKAKEKYPFTYWNVQNWKAKNYLSVLGYLK
jgi:hypothetical protein